MKALRIIRPINCLMASLAVFIGILVASNFFELNFSYDGTILALFSAFFVTGAGNIINDYYDYKIDNVNKPHRPIPSGDIRRSIALFLSLGFFLVAIFLASLINYLCFLLALINAFLLIIYAKKLKSIPLVGNISIGYLVGSTFLFGGLVIGSLDIIVILFVLSTLATVGREIAKDIEDVEGDREKANTVATELGIKNSSYLTTVPTIAAVLLSPLPFILNLFGFYYLIVVLIADALFIYGVIKLIIHKSKETASSFQKLSKSAMFLSLFSFIVGSIPL